MANSQHNATQNAAPVKVTKDDVIRMYRDMNLPVTDDENDIERQYAALQNRKMADKSNTNPLVRALADEWFKMADGLRQRNQREKLLEIVYEGFHGLCIAAIGAQASRQITELTQETVNHFRGLARTQCGCVPALEDQWVDRLLTEEGWAIGESFVQPVHPALVQDLSAKFMIGKIQLTWRTPATDFDSVEIVREEEGAPQSSSPASPVVFHPGSTTLFVDQDTRLVPGTWYIYKAFSWFKGEKSSAWVPVRAACMAEARDVDVTCGNGKITVKWKAPCDDASTIIFRRVGGPPAFQRNGDRLEAAGAGTRCVSVSGKSVWEDHDLTEGETHHYLIVTDFGQGNFTEGVRKEVRVPKVPPAPAVLSSKYQQTGHRHCVQLVWEPVRFALPVAYVVVGREGSAPPARIADGKKVAETQNTNCLDEDVIPGKRYSYAVFTLAGGQYSRTGTAAPPVDILADATDPIVQAGDGTVDIQWRTPQNCGAVTVRRSLSPVMSPTDGAEVTPSGPGHLVDTGLPNGITHHYAIYCIYAPEGKRQVHSPGMHCTGTPTRLPDAARDFKAVAHGAEVQCTWVPPNHGQVVVLRSDAACTLPHGQRLNAAEVASYGRPIVTSPERAVDASPDPTVPYYSIFTIAGSHAVFGGSACCVVSTDVINLRCHKSVNRVILRWTWPSGCNSVLVVRRMGEWPSGPRDDKATTRICTRTDYMSAGEKYTDTLHEARGMLHYIVYAIAPSTGGQFYSPGLAPGCRAKISWGPCMTIYYSLDIAKVKAKNPSIQLNWRVQDPDPQFAGFALLAAQQKAPAALSEGVQLLRWVPGGALSEAPLSAQVDLTPVATRGWETFYCRVVLLDPAKQLETLVLHPNLCECLSLKNNRKVELPPKQGPIRKFHKFKHGAPAHVACPSCFETFPVGDMLFRLIGSGGQGVRGRHTWLDRVRKRGPQPPMNPEGQRLTERVCPKNSNCVLPFTAGSHESLVVGLIGARSSGKSTYVASLVESLLGHVGANWGAGMLPVTEQTQMRYEQLFRDPLFKLHRPLQQTLDAPPPLIYDVTIDASIWGEKEPRAITLDLFDTAGENLEDPQNLAKFVKYLKIASGIIFLIDPLQEPGIRDKLQGIVPLPDLDSRANPHNIISNVLNKLQEQKAITGETLSIPVAVAFNKCDALCESGLIETNRAWNTDMRHIRSYNSLLHDDICGMMAEFTKRWCPGAYSLCSVKFPHHAFFGVSATGCAPDPRTNLYPFISPWRVEDPLLWLFWKLGVIPSSRSGT